MFANQYATFDLKPEVNEAPFLSKKMDLALPLAGPMTTNSPRDMSVSFIFLVENL